MKVLLLVLTVVILTFFALGCIKSEDKINYPSDDITSAHTPSSGPVSENISELDKEWGRNALFHANSLKIDVDSISQSENNSDYDSIISSGQTLVNDTQSALDDNAEYIVAPQYQDAQKEWVSTLQDLNSAGQATINLGKSGKAERSIFIDKVKETRFMLTAFAHFKKTKAYLDNTVSN
jgi:hypothetical protein